MNCDKCKEMNKLKVEVRMAAMPQHQKCTNKDSRDNKIHLTSLHLFIKIPLLEMMYT